MSIEIHSVKTCPIEALSPLPASSRRDFPIPAQVARGYFGRFLAFVRDLSLRRNLAWRCAVRVAWILAIALSPLWTPAVQAAEPPSKVERFVESVDDGFAAVHWNGMSGELYFVEMMGPGGAVFDLEGDGDLDVYMVQGAPLGPKAALRPWAGKASPRDILLRNDLQVKDGVVHRGFTDISAAAHTADGYGMGVAAGDFDNDGLTDIYVTNFGANTLLRNRGDGTFEDRTAAASAGDDRWSTSASFFDYDRDGWLDLFIVNYVRFELSNNVTCYATSSRRDYCGPSAFPAQGDRLLHNRGDGTFEDRTAAAGLARTVLPGLGVQTADFDGDGWLDIYVANDGEVNSLWLNGKDGTFSDEALLFGVAVNRQGRPEASMGVTAGDFDADGDQDLFVAHLDGESNTFYLSDSGFFEDRTRELGLAAPSLPFTSFGTGFLDVDNDGWLDLLVVNGAVKVLEAQARQGETLPLAQRNQLFLNRPEGTAADKRRFVDVSDRSGSALQRSEVSRGAAFGDLDNDGDTDVIVFNNNSAARLLWNDVGQSQPWLGLDLRTGPNGVVALGAEAVLRRRGAPDLWRRVASDGSFSSANDSRALFGLAEGQELQGVEVSWPDGQRERFETPPLGRYTTLKQGSGRPIPPPSNQTPAANAGAATTGAANTGGKNEP